MNIIFTRHAKNRMRWRKITPEEINLVLNSFDRKEELSANKFYLFKSIGTRLLRITVVREENNLIIISVVDKLN